MNYKAKWIAMALIAVAIVGNKHCRADEVWLSTDIGSRHFNRTWDWNESHNLLALEYVANNNYFVAVSSYKNSFSQSTYAFQIGKMWKHKSGFFYRTTGGGTQGYSKDYEREAPEGRTPYTMPNNAYIKSGWSGLFAQGVGYEYLRVKTELTLLGAEAIIWTVGIKLF